MAPRGTGGRPPVVRPVVQRPAVLARRTPLWRRLLALVGLGSVSIVAGVVIAVIVGALAAAVLVALTSAVTS